MAEALLDSFLNCPVCLETFREPVTLGCNHSFCSSCLQDYWDQNQTKNCPVCRRKSSKDEPGVNFALRELSNSFREKLKLTAQTQKESTAQTQKESTAQTKQWAVCSTHPEVPPLFCKDEARALCPVCEFSLHTQHTVLSGEEAERELKEQLRSQLHSLTQQRQSYEELQKTYERLQRHSEEQVEHCERQIRALFSGMQRFLKEEEDRALAALREEQHRQEHTMGPELQSIREQLSSLSQSIQDLEQQLQKDTWAFLKASNEINSKAQSKALLSDPWTKAGLLINQAKVLGNLGFRVWRRMRSLVQYSPVILDPNTANRWLCLSEDLRGVRCGETENKELPLNPERFTYYADVLGSEGFSSGTHQWDVEVGDHPLWVIGLVKESIDREQKCDISPETGRWCLGLLSGTYRDVFRKPLKLQRHPEKIRVQLDYDRGQLTFSDADHMTPICSYKGTFTEKLFPYFSVGKAGEAETKEIKICEDHTVKE